MVNVVRELIEETFDPFLYNQNVDHDILRTNLEYPIKYSVVDIKKDHDILKKYFIIDIRNLTKDKIDYMFENFDELQRVLLSDSFLDYHEIEEKNNLSTYPYNLELIFLENKERNYNINKYDVLYNTDYALKSFMTEEELKKLLTKEFSFKNIDKDRLLTLKERIIKLSHFNFIYGDNSSGKTKLLNEISKKICMPIFSMDNFDLNIEREIQDINGIKNIMYNLSGTYDIDKYSDYSKYIYRLSQVLEFSKEHNNIVLLDDLRWSSLDSRNYIKLINGLAEYSYEHTPVVLTGCQGSKLIKRKVYKSNIIFTNNK